MAYTCQLGGAFTCRAAASNGEAMRMGALLHNGYVGWLLLAVGQRTPRAAARAQAAVGAGARELTSSYYRGRGQGVCGGFEAARKAHF